MRRQAQNFSAEFLLAEVTKFEMGKDIKSVYTNRGVLQCFGVLLATGAHPRKVGFAGYEPATSLVKDLADCDTKDRLHQNYLRHKANGKQKE